MKKVFVFGAFVAALSLLASCNKENSQMEKVDSSVTIFATYEQPVLLDDTKVSIVESGSKFNLQWEGTESLIMVNSGVNNNRNTDFVTTDSGSTSATFTGGDYPAVEGSYSAATVNYIGIVSSFGSAANTTARGAIKIEQTYDPVKPLSIAQNAFLIGRVDDCPVGGPLSSDMTLKTMNAFVKLSLIKGTTASGSSNEYDKMYVKNIVISGVNEEYIAGRFGVSKTAADWYSSYAEEVTGQVSKTVTLDCTSGATTKGVELGASAKDFYIAIAFKTYAKGLKIAITVQNDNGDTGQVVGYYSKNTSIDVARNTMLKMATLTVNPVDYTEDIICWSENWNGGEADQTPAVYLASASHSGTYVYDNQTITYAQNTNNTKLYTGDMSAGGVEPELLLAKKFGSPATAGTWTVTGIPTAGAASLSLTYKSNKSPTVTCPTDGVSISGSSKNYTITTNGASTITLVFTNNTTQNARLDDILLKVNN